MIKRLLDLRFLRFLLVGGLNTAFGYGIFALFILLGIHYAIAAFLSTVCGVLFNFKTIGHLVFDSRDNSLLARFFGVYGVTYVLGVLCLRISTAYQWDVLTVAALLLLPMAGISYTLNRVFVFGAYA